MRILYFSLDYTPHDHRFLAALARSEHQVAYLRLQRGPRQTEDRPLPPGIRQIRWRGGQRPYRRRDLPALWWDFRRVVRAERPDLIHAGPLQTVALFPALLRFHPLVSMSWGYDLQRDAERGPFNRWATRQVLRHSDWLIADCQAVAQRAQAWGFPPERIALVPWGVDLQHFSPQPADGRRLRARLGWDDAFVVFHNRSWEPLYGVDVMAQAFLRAARQEPRLRLMLLGGGSLAPLLHRLFHDAQMLDRVHFFGQVSQRDLPRYYRAADLYVSASHTDGSSVSLMEALACGLPVAVSDIPSNREWVTPGQEGWLFPDGDADALAACILQAARLPPAERAALGRRARARAEAQADWTRNFQRILAVYRRAVHSSQKEPAP